VIYEISQSRVRGVAARYITRNRLDAFVQTVRVPYSLPLHKVRKFAHYPLDRLANVKPGGGRNEEGNHSLSTIACVWRVQNIARNNNQTSDYSIVTLPGGHINRRTYFGAGPTTREG